MKITYIHHSAFLVETESAYLLFDYFQGKLPEFSEEKPLYVFASHRHPDHFSKVIFELEEKHPKIHYILAFDIWSKRVPESCKEVGDSLNLLAFKRDGKHTMHYCLMFFLVGWVTLGIGWLVWYHRVSGRIGEEQAARGLPVTVTASTFWLWGILGSLIAVGPFIYIYKLLHAMNDLSADYNVRGF